MISEANAVPNPEAVVVHPQHAHVAELAVVGTRRLYSLAALTDLKKHSLVNVVEGVGLS